MIDRRTVLKGLAAAPLIITPNWITKENRNRPWNFIKLRYHKHDSQFFDILELEVNPGRPTYLIREFNCNSSKPRHMFSLEDGSEFLERLKKKRYTYEEFKKIIPQSQLDYFMGSDKKIIEKLYFGDLNDYITLKTNWDFA